MWKHMFLMSMTQVRSYQNLIKSLHGDGYEPSINDRSHYSQPRFVSICSLYYAMWYVKERSPTPCFFSPVFRSP